MCFMVGTSGMVSMFCAIARQSTILHLSDEQSSFLFHIQWRMGDSDGFCPDIDRKDQR